MQAAETEGRLLEVLPRVDCGECGFETCRVFARVLIKHGAKPSSCPRCNANVLASILGEIFRREASLFSVNASFCNGCGNCVAVCPVEGVLAVQGGKARVLRADLCLRFGPEDGTCRTCADVCPSGGIEFE